MSQVFAREFVVFGRIFWGSVIFIEIFGVLAHIVKKIYATVLWIPGESFCKFQFDKLRVFMLEFSNQSLKVWINFSKRSISRVSMPSTSNLAI